MVDPTSMDPEEAIYEAAEAPSIRNNPKWPLVKKFLIQIGVKQADLDTKPPTEWIDMLSSAMKELDAVKNDVKEAEARKLMKLEKVEQKQGDRSMESRRESDGDSGIQLEHYQELVCCKFPQHLPCIVKLTCWCRVIDPRVSIFWCLTTKTIAMAKQLYFAPTAKTTTRIILRLQYSKD